MTLFYFSDKRYLFILFVFFFLQGCGSSIFQKTDTKIYSGTGRYTGEFFVYRADDAWAPVGSERSRYYIGDSFDDKAKIKTMRQWVPVREKDDISGLDGPDRIVTKEDLVKISLRNVFIKYFKEKGKGELALILSFASGEKIKEDLLIYASQGQTLGSSLALDDLTIIGPGKIEGQSIRVRLIMIEVDQIENDVMKDFIKNAAGLASTLQPQYATAIKIASDVARFIISSNQDDTVFDRTFELTMTQKGASIETTPLLYGQYILLLQEDRFQGHDVKKRAEIATRPPAIGDMRFNLHAGRLFTTYMYRPTKLYDDSSFESPDFTVGGAIVFDLGNKRIDFRQFFSNPPDDGNYYLNVEEHENILKKIAETQAVDFRHKFLAFPETATRIGDPDIWGDLGRTLAIVYCDSMRYTSKEKKSCEDALAGEGKKIFFHFPVYLYPKAYTILAQYPFHTHIVLSVSRSVGTTEKAVEDRFITYEKWLETAKKEFRDTTTFNEFFDTIRKDLESQAIVDVVLRKAEGEKEKEKKVCIIATGISNERVVVKNSLYNELFHLTGEIFRSEDEIQNYIKNNYPNCKIK
jgi:hypothetical protein